MGEMFENARVFVKNVADVFGKTDGHRSKCPRCKGSGLNSGRQFWNWNQSSSNMESCWFCEGVGVMPVIGFNGFTLGPSKSLLNTRSVNPLPEPPMKMQLYLGKYPETKCTVKTFKPAMKLSDLLYDPNQFLSWMNGAMPSEIPDRGSVPSTLSSSTTEPVASKSRVSVSSRQPNSRLSQGSPIRGLSFGQSPSEQRVTGRSVKVAPRRSGGSVLVTVRKTMCTSLSAPMRVSSSTRPAEGASRKSPVLRTTRSKRAPRRERNRVREEAEKEAYLRAYKFQKSCASQPEARSSAVSESPDSRQLGGDKMEHLRSLSLGATGVAKSRSSLIMPSLKISSDSSTINQLALGKVKDGIVRSPSLGKAFQLH